MSNGGNPEGGVTIGPGGTLYGTASDYGAHGYGTVWEFQGAFVTVPEPSSMALARLSQERIRSHSDSRALGGSFAVDEVFQ
jgi:hypothetical protein